MKCINVGCNHEAEKQAQTLWGDNEIIGFCKDHEPKWMKSLKIGDNNNLGFYKRVK